MSDSLDTAGVISIRPVASERHAASDAGPPAALQFIAITFHPIRPIVYLATEHVIYVYDLSISGLLGHVRVGATERITHVLASATHPLMIAAIDSGSLYVWEQNTFSLIMVLQTAAKEALEQVQISMTQPVIYYTRASQREVGFVDLMKGPAIKLDLGRKGAQCLAVHPSKPEVACGCADGHVRFWDTAGKVSAGVDDFATMQTTANKNATVVGISQLAFDPLQHNLVAAASTGLTVIWSLGKTMKVLGSRRLVSGDLSLLSLHFHPRHALFYALTSNGVLSSWTYLKAAKDGNTIVSGTMAIGDLGAKEANARLAGTPSYLMPPTVLACNPISLRQHPKLNYTTFLYQPDFSFGGPAHLLQHAIYSLAEDNLSAFAPPVTSYNFPWRPELDEPVTFTYPAELYYFAKTNVLNAYLPAYAENILKKKIPEQDSEGIIVRPLRLAHNAHSDRFLILTVPNQQAISAQQLLTASHSGQLGLPPAPAATRVVLWHPSAPDSFSARAARDACWAVEGADLLLLLSEGGRRADLLPAAADRPLSATDLAEPAARVFTTPLPDGVVLYHVPESNALVYSANVAAQRTKEEPAYSLSRRPGDRLALQRDESVVQVNWHGSGLLFAVVTSHRTLLVARELTLLAQYVYPTNYTRPFCSSALWAGAALLMTTPTHLVYMTVEGAVRTVASLEQPGAVLLSVLNDKVVFAASNRTNTEIRAQPVGLLEPLVCGQLAYAAWRHTPAQELRVHLQRILARFDATRVSDNVYATLTAAGFPDAVASLLLVAPSPSLPHLYRAAVGSLRFDLALAIQRDRRGSDLPPPSELGRACIAYGQFDTARRVYELSNDFLALLQLYASCGNRPGVEQLLERAKKDEALKHHVPVVERILKVRTFGPSPTTLLPNWRIQSTMQEFDTTPVTAAAMLSAGKAAAADFIQPVGRLDTLDKHMAALHDRFAGKEPRGPAYLASAPEAVRPSAPATLPEPVVRAPPVRTVSERQVGAVISASGSAPPSPAGSGSSNSMASPSKESAVVITLASATNAATIPADFVARDKPDAARATAVDARANIIPSGELLTPLRPPPMARSLKATSSTLSIRRSPSDEDLARQADSDDDVPPNENDDDFSDDEGPEDGSSQSEPASPKRSSEAPASAPGTPNPGGGSNPPATPGQLRDSPASSPAPSSVSSGSVPPSPLTLKRDSVSAAAAAAAHPALVAPPASALPPPMPPPPAALAASTGGSSDAVLERISSGSGSGIGSGIGSVLRVAQLSDDTLAAFEKDLTPDSGNPIRTSLLSGLSKLEKGNFAPALEDVEETIRQLADVPDNESNKMLMRLCVAYKLALKLLIEIKLLEKDPAGDRGKLAVYAKLLSDARLLPKHRVICARMAVNKNLEAGNYGVAARLLQTLLPLHLPDHASHETKLKKCEEEKLADGALPPPYTCPGCSTSVSVGASVCPTCGRTPYFCGLSWQILATKFCHGCVYCGALFHPDLLPLGTRCSYCNHGYVDKHSILH